MKSTVSSQGQIRWFRSTFLALLILFNAGGASSAPPEVKATGGIVQNAAAVAEKMKTVTVPPACADDETAEPSPFVVSWVDCGFVTGRGEITVDDLTLRMQLASSFESSRGIIMSMLRVEGKALARNESVRVVQDHVGEWFARALYDSEGDNFRFLLPLRFETAVGEARNGIVIFRCDGQLSTCDLPRLAFASVIADAGRNPQVEDLFQPTNTR